MRATLMGCVIATKKKPCYNLRSDNFAALLEMLLNATPLFYKEQCNERIKEIR